MTEAVATDTQFVELSRVGDHIAVVTLNRPAARNAVNGAVATALEKCVDIIEADDELRVAVLASSHDQVFSAGADLKAVAAGERLTLSTERGGFAGFVFRKRSKPWIAAVDGKALAGGCELALACDMIVASRRARFGLPEVKRGLIAVAGGVFRLAQLMPRNIAIEFALTADELDGERAAQFGLVNRLVADGAALEEALRLAEAIAANAPIAVRETLRLARAAATSTEAELRFLCDEMREAITHTEDYKEGPRAFIEKREPRWTGR